MALPNLLDLKPLTVRWIFVLLFFGLGENNSAGDRAQIYGLAVIDS